MSKFKKSSFAFHALHGDIKPRTLAKELRAFSEAALVLSSDQPRLINKYPNRWVGVYQGHVAADAPSLGGVIAKLKRSGVQPSDVLIRYIEKKQKTLIL